MKNSNMNSQKGARRNCANAENKFQMKFHIKRLMVEKKTVGSFDQIII